MRDIAVNVAHKRCGKRGVGKRQRRHFILQECHIDTFIPGILRCLFNLFFSDIDPRDAVSLPRKREAQSTRRTSDIQQPTVCREFSYKRLFRLPDPVFQFVLSDIEFFRTIVLVLNGVQ